MNAAAPATNAASAAREDCRFCGHDVVAHRAITGGYSDGRRPYCRVCGRWCEAAAYHGERGT